MKQWKNEPVTKADWQGRLNLLVTLVMVSTTLITWRLFQKSVIEHPIYAAKAESQYEVARELPSKRGAIWSQDYSLGHPVVVASTEEMFDISVVPRNVTDKQEAAKTLAQVFDLDEGEVLAKIDNDKLYIPPLVRGVPKKKRDEIIELGFTGLLIDRHHQRVYPEGSLAAHVLGFVNREGTGNYGIEGYYEDELHGISGSVVGERDTLGRIFSTVSEISPEDGVDIELTIDHNVQYAAEDLLYKTVEQTQAESGQVIVMDPNSGEIIALAGTPAFDPNKYFEIPQEEVDRFLNPTVSSVYEPGSIMKPVVMASALDLDKVEPDTEETFGKSVWVQGYEIKTALEKAYGRETMTQVLENSDNVGMVWVSDKMSADEMYEKFTQFGFNELTGIDLSGEVSGKLLGLANWRPINKATMSFGQGISASPLQMVRAWATLINGGKLVTPHLVTRLVGERGVSVTADSPISEGVISPETSDQIRGMLESVVKNGPYGRTRVDGYRVGAKSGTAQVASPEGGYSESDYTHSLMGFFPADAPKFLVLAKLDKPKSAKFAESTAGPLFNQLAKYILNYYKIPPTE